MTCLTRASFVRTAVGLAACTLGCAGTAAAPPMTAGAARELPVTVCDAVWRDAGRSRDVPVRIRIPEGNGAVPLILFSHGLGGSLDAGTEWATHWSSHGFAVVHLQHPGSDEALWREVQRPAERFEAMLTGMSGVQLLARVDDVRFVLSALDERDREGGCDLSRIDLSRVGMSGHSFGAHTTQAVSGQVFAGAGARRTMREPRVDAAIAFSPAPPQRADEPTLRTAFGSIEIPFFSITGTRDEVPALTRTSPEDRTLPYRHMPGDGKYLLVFEGADHAAFGGSAGERRGRRGQNEHVSETVKAATLAFWRLTLLGDAEAGAWLAGSGLRSLLEPGDTFSAK